MAIQMDSLDLGWVVSHLGKVAFLYLPLVTQLAASQEE